MKVEEETEAVQVNVTEAQSPALVSSRTCHMHAEKHASELISELERRLGCNRRLPRPCSPRQASCVLAQDRDVQPAGSGAGTHVPLAPPNGQTSVGQDAPQTFPHTWPLRSRLD